MKLLAKPRGFSAIELSIVLAMLAVAVPIAWNTHLQYQSRLDTSRARVELAAQMRQLTREIRADRWQGRWVAAEGLELELPCGRVTYELEKSRLFRRGPATCGKSRMVAEEITSISREGSLVTVRLARTITPGEKTRVELLMGVRP